MTGALWLGALAGCVGSVRSSDIVEDVSIVAIKVDPPVPISGDDARIEVYVANPDALELDVLIWTCVPTGESSCAEGELGWAPADRALRLRLDGTIAEVTVPVPSLELAGVVPRTAAVLVWTLACVPGRCAIFDELAAWPDDPALHSRLDLPLKWEDMPGFEEATLGFRRLDVAAKLTNDPNRNPRIAAAVQGEHWIAIASVDPDDGDEVELRSVATTGDFELVEGGGWWYGGGSGHLFVVATDGREGLDVRVLTR